MRKITLLFAVVSFAVTTNAGVGQKAGEKVNQAVNCAKEVKRGFSDARRESQSGSGACYGAGQSAGKALNQTKKEAEDFKKTVKKK